MPALQSNLRNSLEKAVVAARDAAEEAARSALIALDVNKPQAYSKGNNDLRTALRARARQFSGLTQKLYGEKSVLDGFERLVEEVAYEQWHRMLFARFLAENNLLMHPEGVAVSLQDCAELALEEGEPDAWTLAARYASLMLPGIFRQDDPAVQVRFAPEGRDKLETILNSLPSNLFQAEDALGWVYQFWQSKKKDEVNKSGQKIGGSNISPVTQLFTEDYMVRFLLENSLGAWWAGKHPHSPLLKDYSFLRYKEDGTPAAGIFEGWPSRVAEVTVMDPCCGSGHFLVAAFEMLRKMRMEEEGLDEAEASDAVLRDNLFGLELDGRCVQIAAFAVALAAWKAGGYRELPLPNIACSGIPVKGQLEDWLKLAGDDVRTRNALTELYNVFKDADTLGSLINPAALPGQNTLWSARYEEVEGLLEKALLQEIGSNDPTAAVFGASVIGTTQAAKLLSKKYILVVTNVPYLARGKQGDILREYSERVHPEAKADLALSFLERCKLFTSYDGTYSLVTPQSWLFLKIYKVLRETFLRHQTWVLLVPLGANAFETISGEVVNVLLSIINNKMPGNNHFINTLDATSIDSYKEKVNHLQDVSFQKVGQRLQLNNPDNIVTIQAGGGISLLSKYADSFAGIQTGDDPRYRRCFWETNRILPDWRFDQTTVRNTNFFGGRHNILYWKNEGYELKHNPQAYIRGIGAWGKNGISVSQMQDLPVTLYSGSFWDMNCCSIVPKSASHLPALWAYCASPEFSVAVRQINQSLKVNPGYLVKIPFDLDHWQKVADEMGPLPEPYSNDPTQWLFEGNPVGSTEPLQVSVARLLGYIWPQQKADVLDKLVDADGIVCLPPVSGELPAAERLRALLSAAYGLEWSVGQQDKLLAQVGYSGKSLDQWLRDGFFEQHCRVFQNRPFIWQIWDGQKEGFSALVNYHKLDNASLNKLIYTYLGDWIGRKQEEADALMPGAEAKLVAAQNLKAKLEAIRDGQPPYDIYVRWKKLHEQPIGWNPDLNDGVRLNVRPFVTAGILRSKFTINWNKDRGANPDGSERLNDQHLTNQQKREAQQKAGK